jgi:SNF2 family DNA or RNA helicase
MAWIGAHENEPIAAPIVVAQLMRLQQFAVGYAEMVWGKKTVIDPDSGERRTIEAEVLRLADPSAKIDAFMELVDDHPDKQFAIYSQSKQAINLVANRLRAKNITVGVFTGDTKPRDRDEIIDDFQAGKIQIFAGTIQAGGEGITLTAADTLVFLDRSWVPAKNRQVEDRLHRIGQRSSVHIIDIVAKDTIDLGRMQKIEQKWSWIKELLGDPKEVKKKLVAGIAKMVAAAG